MTIERVVWIDSQLEVYQVSTDELPEPVLVDSVGYVARETPGSITLARERIGREWRGAISIPRECVRERVPLALAEPVSDAG
jgi:hypothetical protein